MSAIPGELQSAKKQLEGGNRVSVTTRELLRWFKAERRSPWVVTYVRAALNEVGVITTPDFEGVNIDATLSLALAPEPPQSAALPAESLALKDSVALGPDPTLRIRILKAAITEPLTVQVDAPLSTAITSMITHDYSQLPVMRGKQLRGAITWRSIGKRLALGAQASAVADFLEPALEISLDSSLLSAIGQIIERDYALVRTSTGRLSGIVTTADLSQEFRVLSEPFLLLREAENYLRRILEGKIRNDELNDLRDPNMKRDVSSISDLTFGEYVRIVERREMWDRLDLKLDRKAFLASLERVRALRNDVMHFDPDPIEEPRLVELRNFVRLLQTLAECRIVLLGGSSDVTP